MKVIRKKNKLNINFKILTFATLSFLQLPSPSYSNESIPVIGKSAQDLALTLVESKTEMSRLKKGLLEVKDLHCETIGLHHQCDFHQLLPVGGNSMALIDKENTIQGREALQIITALKNTSLPPTEYTLKTLIFDAQSITCQTLFLRNHRTLTNCSIIP